MPAGVFSAMRMAPILEHCGSWLSGYRFGPRVIHHLGFFDRRAELL